MIIKEQVVLILVVPNNSASAREMSEQSSQLDSRRGCDRNYTLVVVVVLFFAPVRDVDSLPVSSRHWQLGILVSPAPGSSSRDRAAATVFFVGTNPGEKNGRKVQSVWSCIASANVQYGKAACLALPGSMCVAAQWQLPGRNYWRRAPGSA